MRYSFAPLALAAFAAATPVPQSSSSDGCQTTYSGSFQIQVVNATKSSKRSIEERQTALTLTLNNGDLKDSDGRTGYIASNNQFQFDKPPQANYISEGGYSVCANATLGYSTLNLNGNDNWFKCLSGTFYNIYDENDAGQCSPIYIEVLGGAPVISTSSSSSSSTSSASSSSSAAPATTTSSASYSSASSASTSAPVSQQTDGQATASPAAPITQISDHQPQAPTSVASPVTQISDGQPQAVTSTAVSQISDGQPQAPTGNSSVSSPTPSASVEASTGDASSLRAGVFGLAAAVAAAALI